MTMLGGWGRTIVIIGVALGAAMAHGTAATAGDPPEAAILADFAATHGEGWATLTLSSEPITVPVGAPLAPDGLALPADGWEVVVQADGRANEAVSAFYYAVGTTFWLWQEASSTRDDPTTTTVATPTTPDVAPPTTTWTPLGSAAATPPASGNVAEVWSAAIERPVRSPWTSAHAPSPN